MRNPTPRTGNEITTLAGQNIAGLTALGSDLGITQISPADLQGLLDGYVSANTIFNQARTALGMAYDEFHTAEDALSAWLGKVRAIFTTAFGTRWSAQWVPAGYVTPSTALPRSIDGRLGLALRVIDFLAENPGFENAPAGVTAAIGTTLRTAAVTTQQAVASALTSSKQMLADRAAAAGSLLATMRRLVLILTVVLAPDSALWTRFGLNAPASESTPAQPQNLSATALGTGDILVRCDAVPLATRYRWRTRIVGVDQDYTLAGSTADVSTVLGEFAPGVTLEIIVQAVNGGLQGMPSEPIEFTVPEAAAAAEPKLATSIAAATMNRRLPLRL